jgi:hypothetical protein
MSANAPDSGHAHAVQSETVTSVAVTLEMNEWLVKGGQGNFSAGSFYG